MSYKLSSATPEQTAHLGRVARFAHNNAEGSSPCPSVLSGAILATLSLELMGWSCTLKTASVVAWHILEDASAGMQFASSPMGTVAVAVAKKRCLGMAGLHDLSSAMSAFT